VVVVEVDVQRVPINYTFWFHDIEGAYTQTWAFHVPSTSSFADVIVFGDYLADVIQAISDCVLVGYNIIVSYLESPYPYPSATAEVINEHGVFIFDTATPGNRWLTQVPAVNPNILKAPPDPMAGIEIDQLDAGVIAFRDSIINGNGTIAPIDKLDDDIVTLATAYRQWRRVSASEVEKG
jgi:hypothetical protein